MSKLSNSILNKVKDHMDSECENGSISGSERILSVIAGGFIFTWGIRQVLQSPLSSLTKLSVGGALVARGISGYCPVQKLIDNVKDEPDDIQIVEHRYFVK